MNVCIHDSPVGPLTLASLEGQLVGCFFANSTLPADVREALERSDAVLEAARHQVDAYFAGTRTRFELPLAPRGTAFQQSVWQALTTIPFGQTRTYGGIAAQLGRPTASRAVGAANGQNPIAIVIPCHRVIGSTGALTGFGGGIHRKQQLLELEGAQLGLFAAG
jgi:methylated-DNA-[protein]-cysteine S-methyltransferase